MIRLLGTNLQGKKKLYIALTAIYGVGVSKSLSILKKLEINPDIMCDNVGDINFIKLRSFFEENVESFEGPLKRAIAQNIQKLIQINCYIGKRHLKGLPVRGQRTRTNSKTASKKRVKKI